MRIEVDAFPVFLRCQPELDGEPLSATAFFSFPLRFIRMGGFHSVTALKKRFPLSQSYMS